MQLFSVRMILLDSNANEGKRVFVPLLQGVDYSVCRAITVVEILVLEVLILLLVLIVLIQQFERGTERSRANQHW